MFIGGGVRGRILFDTAGRRLRLTRPTVACRPDKR
ncbi:hypothetical protein CKO_02765 [Citrobacter koseri ATCC BAA-895]|uniref:Uncharacterized protein n=1 Tax=Citrobacter koseri (strain ATCC BAA-895 / CDC 4225-83 / SGSC4696) TaxID=290338 RepID=A8AK59_CITK8|nr:hypothetical protein CKO_02765 [Citrobacter koseri ATCC BAA-895]